jgi:A/G-specific adenine glycosylase
MPRRPQSLADLGFAVRAGRYSPCVTDLERRRLFIRRLLAWGRANRRPFPWRSESDPFRILVAEVLLQRSRARTVAKVYVELFDSWATPAALASAPTDRIAAVIRPLGLTGRARHIKRLAGEIATLGHVPSDPEQLIRLSGVGRYAANATVVASYDRALPVVDGVTARVYRRHFGLSDSLPPASDDSLWRVVAEVSPKSASRDWNWAVLDLAAAICLPKRPRCESCPLKNGCAWSARDLVSAKL